MLTPDLVIVDPTDPDPRCPQAVSRLLDRVRQALPRTAVHHLQLSAHAAALRRTGQHPGHRVSSLDPAEIATTVRPQVLVPLSVGAEYLMREAIRKEVDLIRSAVTLTPALGPSVALARALASRLYAVGAGYADAVVLVGASADPMAQASTDAAATMLGDHFAAVSTATASHSGEDVTDAVARWRDAGYARVFVAPHLLLPGAAERDIRRLGRLAGATQVADVLGDHPLVVDRILARYASGAGRLTRPTPQSVPTIPRRPAPSVKPGTAEVRGRAGPRGVIPAAGRAIGPSPHTVGQGATLRRHRQAG